MKILKIQNGLRTKFDPSNVQFKKTFNEAKKLGIDLNNTTNVIKRNGLYLKVSFLSGRYSKKNGGRYWERIDLLPMM